jgi:hypothetical protein
MVGDGGWWVMVDGIQVQKVMTVSQSKSEQVRQGMDLQHCLHCLHWLHCLHCLHWLNWLDLEPTHYTGCTWSPLHWLHLKPAHPVQYYSLLIDIVFY